MVRLTLQTRLSLHKLDLILIRNLWTILLIKIIAYINILYQIRYMNILILIQELSIDLMIYQILKHIVYIWQHLLPWRQHSIISREYRPLPQNLILPSLFCMFVWIDLKLGVFIKALWIICIFLKVLTYV